MGCQHLFMVNIHVVDVMGRCHSTGTCILSAPSVASHMNRARAHIEMTHSSKRGLNITRHKLPIRGLPTNSAEERVIQEDRRRLRKETTNSQKHHSLLTGIQKLDTTVRIQRKIHVSCGGGKHGEPCSSAVILARFHLCLGVGELGPVRGTPTRAYTTAGARQFSPTSNPTNKNKHQVRGLVLQLSKPFYPASASCSL